MSAVCRQNAVRLFQYQHAKMHMSTIVRLARQDDSVYEHCSMTEDNRINALRCMLLSLSSLSASEGQRDKLMKTTSTEKEINKWITFFYKNLAVRFTALIHTQKKTFFPLSFIFKKVF